MRCICVERHTGPGSDGKKMRRYKVGNYYDIKKAHYNKFSDFFVPGVPESKEIVQSILLRDAGELGQVKSSEELKDFKMSDLRETAEVHGITIPKEVKTKEGIVKLLKPVFDK